MRTKRPQRGFTLVELLTVVGIILFLMALIVGVFLRSLSQAKVRGAQALIQKVGTALAQYQAENRSLPPDTGFNQPANKSNSTYNWNGTTYVTYDTGSLWRYLSKPLKVYAPNGGGYVKTIGPYLTFDSGEIRQYTDPVLGASYQVVDPWGTPIGYIGDIRRVIHNRGLFDIFSCGPGKVTAETNGLGYGMAANQAYDTQDNDGDGIVDNAPELGVAQLNGTLTAARRLRAGEVKPAGEILDNINNWDSQY